MAAIIGAIVIFNAVPASAASCESLASLRLPDTTITLAETVAPGAFKQPAGVPAGPGGAARYDDLPAFCRVAATLKPSNDSDIKMEVWLPVSGWNGKYQAAGNGAWAGSIVYRDTAAALRRGYATSSTDTGHTGGNGSFALGHPEKLIDFGYRAIHETTVKSKAIIAAYYGDGPKLSYFNSCSSGGKQALHEAQKYPLDFDGIIAGAATNNWTGRAAQTVWVAQAVHKEEASYIPPDKYKVLHDAVLQKCDALDGVADGVLENPRQCKFDPAVLQCKAGDSGASCLSAAQVEASRSIYAPVMNPRTKKEYMSGLEVGSEMGWATMGAPQPLELGLDHFRYVVFKDPKWDYKTLDFDKDMELTEKLDNGTVNAMNPDLSAFFKRGGKLIQYHGWNDPRSAPGNSVTYYKSVVTAMGGASKVNDNYRLFMVPGMGHCQGGEGTDNFDKVAALEQWVEKGKAPDQIPASHLTAGKVDKTRPLCPYPQVATYKGSGDTNDAANFVCK
jgi:feruloyl esterase